MNRFIANAFETILNIMHIIVVIALIGITFSDSNGPLLALGIFFIYILFVGMLTTFISINKTLGKIEGELKKQTKHLKSSLPDME